MPLPGRTGNSRQRDCQVSLLGRQFDNVVVGAQGRFGGAAQRTAQGQIAQRTAQGQIAQRADQREHRAQHPQWHIVAQFVDDQRNLFYEVILLRVVDQYSSNLPEVVKYIDYFIGVRFFIIASKNYPNHPFKSWKI